MVTSDHVQYVSAALVIVACVQLVACAAVRAGRAARVFEAASGSSVAAACLLTLLARGTYFPRQVTSTALVVAWGARLSRFLYARPLEREVINVFMRIVWSMLCALPVIICNTQQRERYRTTAGECAGVFVALAALCLEHVSDSQKQRWHARHAQRPTRADVEPPVCAVGLWRYSRHPNLFFELLFHWSIYVIVRPVEAPFVVLSPVALTVLVLFFPGGVLTQELSRNAQYGLYPAYALYRKETPLFFPCPGVFRCFSACAPRATNILCLELTLFDD